MNERLEKARKALQANKIDAMLITGALNRRYLSGFDGTSGVLLFGDEKAFLVTDFRYLEQAAAQAEGFKVKRWKKDLYAALIPLIKESGWKKLGFESKHVMYADFIEMQEKLPAVLVPVENAVEKMRMIKNDAEANTLREGAKELDRAFEHICTRIKPGITEKEIALELEIFLLKQGAEKTSFSFIVASGARGAMPHGVASNKTIESGELVTMDYGAFFSGYATDMTRTVSSGEPEPEMRRIYDLVLEAQQKAASEVKPGMKAKDLDAVARDLFDKAGYGDYFGHGLGHGVGLETHEQPVLNNQSETVLEPGMVITVEPGIYIPGRGGVRIEDMVLVGESAGEILTNSPRGLITL